MLHHLQIDQTTTQRDQGQAQQACHPVQLPILRRRIHFKVSQPLAPFGSSFRTTRAAAKSVLPFRNGHRRLTRVGRVRALGRFHQADHLRKRGRSKGGAKFLHTVIQFFARTKRR